MTTPRTYWTGQQFVAEWTLVDIADEPAPGATVTGTVSRPAGTTAPMVVTADANVYTAAYQVVEAGTHAFRLAATGPADDAYEGTFIVARSAIGLPPITVDPTQPVGMVRLLITDVDETSPLFEDAQIQAFLALEGGTKRAAAAALETIARSEALISKKISTQDLSTDGPAVAKELRESAAALRRQASDDLDDEQTGPDAWAISVIDFDPHAAYRWW